MQLDEEVPFIDLTDNMCEFCHTNPVNPKLVFYTAWEIGDKFKFCSVPCLINFAALYVVNEIEILYKTNQKV